MTMSAGDLARVRFAFSPLWEVAASVRVLKEPGRHPLHGSWRAAAERRLQRSTADLSLLFDLVPTPTKYLPGFLAPTPTTSRPTLAEELEGLRAVPPHSVRTMIENAGRPASAPVRRLHADPARELHRLAGVIEGYWDRAIRPWWPEMLDLLDQDVRHRGALLVEGGTTRLLNELSPRVRWHDDGLRVTHRYFAGTHALDGRGLVLVPSTFVWPTVFSKLEPLWPAALRYPSRGIAELWTPKPRTAPDALASVIGRSRALLLAELSAPRSTTELSRRTRMSAGNASQHLTALRDAGLVSVRREGRYVLYSRTDLAEALLARSS
ncbi:transcriptional regulator [Saccharopolyspora elongata]|uniref:Transcriptional regulator n=2 Tax=Saccharopolyspora elongata TaxID=2530387 RepID=A0A4R4Z8N1_9PSEU|nr:transcriptional regulator [Saccharopolyspora elongata]